MADKIRPGRITDAQVRAYAQATNAGNGGALQTIREGLAAAYVQREAERRAMDREARIRGRVRDLLDEIATPELHPINLDPYPATVGEVADEIARYVLELENGPARGVAFAVWDKLLASPEITSSVPERKVCRVGDHRDGRDAATVRVKYQLPNEGIRRWTRDMCDRHGTLTYERFIREGKRNVEIMPAGWTPAWSAHLDPDEIKRTEGRTIGDSIREHGWRKPE